MLRLTVILAWLCLSVSSMAQENFSITANAFADHPFGLKITLDNIRQILSGNVTIRKKAHVNEDTHKTDSLIIYKSTCCEFSFLRTNVKTVFYDASIIDEGIVLSGGIAIGMTKGNFFKAFKIDDIKSGVDVFIVSNSSATCNHSFYFVDESLATIVIDGCTSE